MRYVDPDGREVWDEDGKSCSITKNDTLSKITENYNKKNGTNIDYKDVAKANKIDNPDLIITGNTLDFSSFSHNISESSSRTTSGDIMIGVNLNFVGIVGFDASIGFVFDLEDSAKSGLFLSGGFAAGVSAGVSLFGGYTNGDFEDSNSATLSIGAGSYGGNIGFSENGKITGSFGVSYGLDAGFNLSKQHGAVIPFDTPEQRENLMNKYYEHH